MNQKLPLLIGGIAVTMIVALIIGSALAHNSEKLGFTNPTATPYIIVSQGSGPATTTRFFGTVSPQVDSLYDLGETSLHWKKIWVDGCAGCGTTGSQNLQQTTDNGSDTTNPITFAGGTSTGDMTFSGGVLINVSPTSTMTIGVAGAVACMALRDSDDGGVTYVTSKGGILFTSATSCQ